MKTADTFEHLKLIGEKAVKATKESHEFVFKTKTVPCTHAVQLTVDFGIEPGPWIVVGLNETAFCLGYLPRN